MFFLLNYIYFKILGVKYKNNDKYVFSTKSFLMMWLIIFILWIPVLLSYYPTLWAYDVYNQVPHLIGDTITTHHPLFHTLFIELFLVIGKSIKDYELGMLLLSIVQMLVLSCIFAFVIEKVKTYINNKLFRKIFIVCMIIFYGLMPFNSIMSISMTKDVLFSSFLLLLVIYLYDFIDGKPSNKIMFIFISVMLLLFKNNSMFIYSCTLIISIFLLSKNEWVKLAKMMLISIIIFYIIFDTALLIIKPAKVSKIERYSVQVQTLNYTLIKHPNIDNKSDEKILGLIPRYCTSYYKVFEKYGRHNSDIVKTIYDNCVGNNLDSKLLLKKWIYYGFKYPVEYIDSWSNLTLGSWFLLDESHTAMYFGENQGYLLTDYKIVEGVSEERPKSKFKLGYDILEKIATDCVQYKIPIFMFLFKPSTYIISFFLMFIYLITKKKKKEILPLILFVALYINILFGPLIIVRYIYPFMIFVPILFVRIISLKK
jgi:hypothetical protein